MSGHPVDIMTSKISLLNLIYDGCNLAFWAIEQKFNLIEIQKEHFRQIAIFHSWRKNRKTYRKILIIEENLKEEMWNLKNKLFDNLINKINKITKDE